MLIGLNLPQYDIDFSGGITCPTSLLALAQAADAQGIDSVWVSDHPFVIGPDGKRNDALDALLMLSAIGISTRSIRIGTLVLAVSMRSPEILDAAARTLSFQAPGRMVFGIGGGWYRPSHQAMGIPLKPYTQRMQKVADVAETLRRAREAAQTTDGPELLIGGFGPQALEIAVRSADTWNLAWDAPPQAYRDVSTRLDKMCETTGRDPASLRRSTGLTVLVGETKTDRKAAVARLAGRSPSLRDITLESLAERAITGSPEECAERILAYGADEVIFTLVLRDDPEMLACVAQRLAPLLRDTPSAATKQDSKIHSMNPKNEDKTSRQHTQDLPKHNTPQKAPQKRKTHDGNSHST